MYIPDETLILNLPDGKKFILLAEVGARFPWAEDKGRVVFGPPIEETDMESLAWETHRYWVIDALDEDGVSVTLTPEEYRVAVEAAEETYGSASEV